jgi:hypothetical protein
MRELFKTKEKLRFILILLLIFFSLILETIGIGMILPIINILIIKERSLGFDLIDNFFVNSRNPSNIPIKFNDVFTVKLYGNFVIIQLLYSFY